MDRYDLHAELVRVLKSRPGGVRKSGNALMFKCVRHDDGKEPAAWIGDNAWGCHRCGFTDPLGTLAEVLGVDKPKRGFSLEDYADKKGLSIANLQRWGLATVVGKYGDDVLAIPYRDAAGVTTRTKYRHASGTFWDERGDTPIHLYGLDILAKSKPTDPVLLVEGESDCHSAWGAGIAAVGLPGASSWKPEWAPLFAGRPVYVWQEPGEAGALMVRKIATDVPHARILQAGDIKDLNALHQKVGADLKAAVKARMAASVPAGALAPVVDFDPLIGVVLDGLLHENLQPVDAVPTMIPDWNAACRDAGGGKGLARGWHVCLGATTGSGKSLLALNLAAEAIRHGERVGFISLEMSQAQLTTRLLSIVSGVPIRHLERGPSFQVSEFQAAAKSLAEQYERQNGLVFTNRAPITQLADVISSMKYLHEVQGCRYMIVDYLQLAYVLGSKNILEQVQAVSHTVRATARDLNVVSVGLSQFNRETSVNRESPPTPQGLMGGSPLENDSDQVILLDHSNYVRQRDEESAVTKLLVAKNRHGPCAEISVIWNYRTLRLLQLSTQSNEAAA